MAKTGAVWGIDIGQCALKALRCRAHEKDANKLVVEAFDYVEYPKLLSQPDADREGLIRDALETFLSRNEVKGDRVAISVAGQAGLARFIKLPPVESKKIPDIVKYEARQQIPFALEDVVWDYQPLLGGSHDEGYALETEVGLFAMKRDQCARALRPLEDAGVEVDIIQLAPLAVYNYVCFDRLGNLEGAQTFDPEKPPASKVVLSFGAETTDLVITNGFRVWQRNIPIGGSHFTKALTKELKLTFAKAEHLKRNATKAEDPKAIFQAMRPVFSDLAAEIQRSLGFYMSNNRGAQLQEIIALGNPMKLPGLQRFLQQNLEQTVKPVDEFPCLVGGSVTATPQFEDNRLTFATAYGLCVQGLDRSMLSTNLLPEEIVTTRMVRGKKPWAIAAAAVLLVGTMVNYGAHVSAWNTVDVKNDWNDEIAASKQLSTTAAGFTSENSELKSKFEQIKQFGDNLQSNADGRLLWLELLKAIDVAMPKDERPAEQRQKSVEDVTERNELHFTSLDCQQFPDLQTWFTGPVAKLYDDARQSKEYREAQAAERAAAEAAAKAAEEAPADAAAPAGATPESPAPDAVAEAAPPDAGATEAAPDLGTTPPLGDEGDPTAAGTAAAGPTGPGWIIELRGHHFHNSHPDNPEVDVDRDNEAKQFVHKTFIRNLLEKSVELPDGPGGKLIDVPITKLGISYPVVVTENRILDVTYDPEADNAEEAGRARMGAFSDRDEFGPRRGAARDQQQPELNLWKLRRYDFIIQFVWQPTPRHERREKEQTPTGPLANAEDAGAAPSRVAANAQ